MNMKKYGISSIGLHFPLLSMPVEELAKLRNVDPAKYTIGLGCHRMALCPPDYHIEDLAYEAAKRALSRWNGESDRIGLIAVGTESAKDMSRPLSAWVAEKLGIKGAVRSYEVKHACYGGTLAVRQALEWKMAGVSPQKAALVIAADIALYEPGDAGEATQGAGAVAMIIDEPLIAEIEPTSFAWSEPAFDFWRPAGNPYPQVNGQLSLQCYQEAAQKCFLALINNQNPENVIRKFHALCFHAPFPKMVKKGFYSICKLFGWNDEKIETYFSNKVEPTLAWNRFTGNAYTASLWIGIANTLRGLQFGQEIAAFSYGSGYGAELLTLKAGPHAAKGAWTLDVEQDLKDSQSIHALDYERLRSNRISDTQRQSAYA